MSTTPIREILKFNLKKKKKKKVHDSEPIKNLTKIEF